MKVRVKYEWEYARQRFVKDGAIVGDGEVLDVDLTELSAKTREGLLAIVGLDALKNERNPGRSGPREPDFDLEWAGPPGDWDRQFLLDGPPIGPREWDEVLGRYFEVCLEHGRRLTENEDAELRSIISALHKELSEEDREGVATGSDEGVSPRRRRHRRRTDEAPVPSLVDLDFCDYDHGTPELLRQVEELADRVRTKREEREAKVDAERRERETREQREQEEQWAAKENRLAEEKERQAQEKQTWIERHGSEHLREAMTAGYDCRDLYVRERVALEWPGYEPHLDKYARWKRLSSPSPEALAEAGRAGGKVAWLVSPAASAALEGSTGQGNWSPCEAVIVRNYLGEYYLIKEIR